MAWKQRLRKRVNDLLSRHHLQGFPVLRLPTVRPPRDIVVSSDTLTWYDFEDILHTLTLSQRVTLNVTDLLMLRLRHPLSPEGPFLLTFETHHPTFLEHVLPRLIAHELSALLVVDPVALNAETLALDDLRGLIGHGVVVAQHIPSQLNHQPLSAAELHDRLHTRRTRMHQVLGYTVPVIATDTRAPDPLLLRQTREVGVQHILTTTPGLIGDTEPGVTLPRLTPHVDLSLAALRRLFLDPSPHLTPQLLRQRLTIF